MKTGKCPTPESTGNIWRGAVWKNCLSLEQWQYAQAGREMPLQNWNADCQTASCLLHKFGQGQVGCCSGAKAGGPTRAPNPFPEHPLEWPEDLEDAKEASKHVNFCLLKMYIILNVHPRVWVFLSQNEEEANWLGKSSRFYAAFTISGNFMYGLYDRVWLTITVSYTLKDCSDHEHSVCTFRAASGQDSFPPLIWIWEGTECIQLSLAGTSHIFFC